MAKKIADRVSTRGTVTLPSTFNPKAFDFKSAAFDLAEDGQDKCQILDTATPIDRPRYLNTFYNVVKDIYKESEIPTAYQLGVAKGVRVVNQVIDTLTIVDDADTTYRVDLPIKATVTLQIPLCDLITEEIVQQQIADAVSSMFTVDAEGNAVSRILRECRGLVKPIM